MTQEPSDTTTVIAIDGYSACGKSTLAKAIADKLGYYYCDSGAMYRGFAWYMLKMRQDLDQPPSEVIMKQFRFETKNFKDTYNQRFLVDGIDVTDLIRTSDISQGASKVAQYPSVRNLMVDLQRQLATDHTLVMDGRDIGSVVFPDARLKLFLKADPDVRTVRRMKEKNLDPSDSIEFAQAKQDLLDRDYRDTHREMSPLVQTEDAVVIDNTNLSLDEMNAMGIALAAERMS